VEFKVALEPAALPVMVLCIIFSP